MIDNTLLFLRNKDCISRKQLENDLNISLRQTQRIIKQLLLKHFIVFDHKEKVKYNTGSQIAKIYKINHFMINQSLKTALDYYNNMVEEGAAATEQLRHGNISDTTKIAAATLTPVQSTVYITPVLVLNYTGSNTVLNTGYSNDLSTSGSCRISSSVIPHSQKWLEIRKFETMHKIERESQQKMLDELDYRNACGSRLYEKKTALDELYDMNYEFEKL